MSSLDTYIKNIQWFFSWKGFHLKISCLLYLMLCIIFNVVVDLSFDLMLTIINAL